MKKSNIIDFQEHKSNRDYYAIGLVLGALRAELETGSIAVEDVYSLLPDGVKSTIGDDLMAVGGVIRTASASR